MLIQIYWEHCGKKELKGKTLIKWWRLRKRYFDSVAWQFEVTHTSEKEGYSSKRTILYDQPYTLKFCSSYLTRLSLFNKFPTLDLGKPERNVTYNV